MTKKIRLIILLVCVASFFIIAPYIVMYSMGYKLDFETWEVTATGGIYVRTYPQADEITFDSKIVKKPSMFGNSVFVQDLLPRQHSVSIKKAGYFDYSKTLEVKEKEVTKIENIVLFKNNTAFDNLLSNVESFSVSPDKKNILAEITNTKSLNFVYFGVSSPTNQKKYSLALPYTTVLDVIWSNDSNKALIKTYSTANGTSYYLFDFSKETQSATPLSYLDATSKEVSFNPQDSSQILYMKNKTLYSVKNKTTTITKNCITYKIVDGNILWMSSDGLLSKSDTSGKLIEEMTKEPIILSADENYKIETISGKTLLTSNNALYLYNPEMEAFDNFDIKINNYKLLQSPDGKNMVYYNGSDIYLYTFDETSKENNIKLFSANNWETISNCFWLNNEYVIFESGNKIIISEIDYRGNINMAYLPQNYEPSTDSTNPKISFNSENNKVYVLTGGILYSSEKLTP